MTSIVGIFVLIILIMVLELVQTTSASSPSYESISREVLASLALLESEVSSLQAEYDSLQQSQSASTDINRLNAPQRERDLQLQILEANDRLSRSHQTIEDLKQALIKAEQVHQTIIAEGLAAEADREKLEDLLAKRAEVQKYASVLETDHPVVYRDKTIEGRNLVLIRLQDGKIMITDSANGSNQTFSGTLRIQQFHQWFATLDIESRQFLLIVNPSGVNDYVEVAATLEKRGAAYGFDVVGEGANFRLRSQLESRP